MKILSINKNSDKAILTPKRCTEAIVAAIPNTTLVSLEPKINVSTVLSQQQTVVTAIQGGGRGPVVNEGQTVDTALLLTLLFHALDSEHFTTAYNAIIDGALVDINTLQTQRGTDRADINTNANNISTNTSNIATNTGSIAAHEAEITTLEAQVALLGTSSSGNEARFLIIEGNQDVLTADVAELQTQINSTVNVYNGYAINGTLVHLKRQFIGLPSIGIVHSRGMTFFTGSSNSQELILGHNGPSIRTVSTVSETASTEYSASYLAANAFDDDPATCWAGETDASPYYVQKRYDKAVRLAAFSIMVDTIDPIWNSLAYAPSSFSLEGSNDGSTWETIRSLANISSWVAGEAMEFECDSINYYSYFRLVITDDNDTEATNGCIYELNFTILDEYEFTPAAILLDTSTPNINTLSWVSTEMVVSYEGHTTYDNEAYSDSLTLQTTTAACCGLRFAGRLQLKNTGTENVAGILEVQVTIDGGAWQPLKQFPLLLNYDGDVVYQQLEFDELLVLQQASHTYQVRGFLITEDATLTTQLLTGQILLDYVEESGLGTVRNTTNQIKWTAIEA